MSDKFEQPLVLQKKILAMLLMDRGFMVRMADHLSPTYFGHPVLMEIARHGLKYWRKYRTVPTKAVLKELVLTRIEGSKTEAAKRKLYIKTIRSIYDTDLSDREYLQDTVSEFCSLKAMEEALIKGAELLEQTGDRSAIKSLIDKACQVGLAVDNGDFYLEDIETRADTIFEELRQGIVPTGMPGLDRAIGGGLGEGELGVVMAPPKGGKTRFLMNVAYGAMSKAVRKNVAYITLEVPKRRLKIRFDSMLTGMSIQELQANPQTYKKRLLTNAKLLLGADMAVQQWPTRTATIDAVQAYVERLEAGGFPIGLLIVDYGDIMKASRRIGEVRHEIASCYEDLRNLATEKQIPVWTGSQANRLAVAKPVITMKEISESFEKVAIADMVLALCQTDEEKKERQFRFFIAAARNAEDGIIIPARLEGFKIETEESDNDSDD